MNASAIASEALERATQSGSTANYSAIYAGFSEKGIPSSDVEPRVNVFSFHAWKALGRSVRKGEHGVKVCTWIPMTKKDGEGNAQPIGKKPRMTTVFHVSQTEANDAPEKARRAEIIAERAAAVTAPDLGGSGYYSTEFTQTGAR